MDMSQYKNSLDKKYLLSKEIFEKNINEIENFIENVDKKNSIINDEVIESYKLSTRNQEQ